MSEAETGSPQNSVKENLHLFNYSFITDTRHWTGICRWKTEISKHGNCPQGPYVLTWGSSRQLLNPCAWICHRCTEVLNFPAHSATSRSQWQQLRVAFSLSFALSISFSICVMTVKRGWKTLEVATRYRITIIKWRQWCVKKGSDYNLGV